jgi:hypothetical protein
MLSGILGDSDVVRESIFEAVVMGADLLPDDPRISA